MRSPTLFCALTLVLAACGKDGGGKSEDSASGTGPAVQIDFATAVSAKSIDATATDNIVAAQRAMNLWVGGMRIVATDPGVIGRMVTGSPPPTPYCWIGPVVPQSAFLLDFSPCETEGITGGVSYKEPPNKPTVWRFSSFTLDTTRVLDGTVGFEVSETSNNQWTLFDTSFTEPNLTTRVPMIAAIDGVEYLLSMIGGANLVVFDNNWSVWSDLVITPVAGGEPVNITLGGFASDDVNSVTKPATPLRNGLSYLDCRCPTSGAFGLDLVMDIEVVSFDLDDLQTEDDGVDDPEVEVAVAQTVSGDAQITVIGCGEYDTVFTTAEPLTVTVDGADLAAEIEGLCNSAVIDDPDRCVALQAAANAAGTIEVSVGENKLANAASRTVEVDFDNAFCRIN